MILAPLRGVTIRCFRETFADELVAAGFNEAITPFVTASAGYDPLKDRELVQHSSCVNRHSSLKITPQFIGKDPEALRYCLTRVKEAGYDTADLNCGCPFPMVRNKGRGSGLLHTPDVLRRMLDVGCTVMGAGKFSVKARLGVERNDELLALMPLINVYPLRFLTVHARNAKQMYAGACDKKAFEQIVSASKVPVVYNGDLPLPTKQPTTNYQPTNYQLPTMIGRAFVRCLGEAENADQLLSRYLDASERELCGEHAVLGRMKELVAYWKDIPAWHRRWDVIKLARSVAELRSAFFLNGWVDVGIGLVDG